MRKRNTERIKELQKQELVRKAAPDLLSALKRVTSAYCGKCAKWTTGKCDIANTKCLDVSAAHRAIAKAEGRDEFFVYASGVSVQNELLAFCDNILVECNKGNPRKIKLEDAAVLIKDIKAGRAKTVGVS